VEVALRESSAALSSGGILAIKGLGGYHLACLAADELAVSALRGRKHREDKPFALMAADVEAARALVELTPGEQRILAGTERPIVLARRRAGARVARALAPRSSDLGVMLPYSPLHHLLLRDAGETLVMTSANRSSEPLAYRDEEAFESLAGIADAFLVGERPIARRVDDSVVRAGCLGSTVLRRARGLAPGAVA